MKHDRMAT